MGHWSWPEAAYRRELAEELGSAAIRSVVPIGTGIRGHPYIPTGKGDLVADKTELWTGQDRKAKLLKVIDLAIGGYPTILPPR